MFVSLLYYLIYNEIYVLYCQNALSKLKAYICRKSMSWSQRIRSVRQILFLAVLFMFSGFYYIHVHRIVIKKYQMCFRTRKCNLLERYSLLKISFCKIFFTILLEEGMSMTCYTLKYITLLVSGHLQQILPKKFVKHLCSNKERSILIDFNQLEKYLQLTMCSLGK